MPTFTFTSPEGKSYDVEGPEGATKEQAFGILQQKIGKPVGSPTTDATAQAKPQRSIGSELGRQAGLTGRYVAEGVAGMFDPVNQALGLPPTSEATGRLLTRAGLPEPETPMERISAAGSKGIVGAAIPGSAAKAVKPLTEAGRGISSALQAQPTLQAASGAGSGVAGQSAAEMGAGPIGQTAASLAGGALPFLKPPPQGIGTPSLKGQTFKDARAHGYVVTPSDVEHTTAGNVMESITNKQKLTAKTSVKNAEARANDIRLELGLGKGNEINPSDLDQVRDNAYDAFKQLVSGLKQAKPHITATGETIPAGSIRPTPEFEQAIKRIADETVGLQSKYPELVQAPTKKRMESLSKQLLQPHDAEDTLDLVKSLRRQASSNLSAPIGARPTPFKEAMGQFQYKAANALEDLMEQNLKDPKLVDAMRQARKTIAQTYDVQYALNPSTGEVSGLKLARRQASGSPFTGALKRAADFARAFPQDNREVARVGGTPVYNAWDFLVAGGTAMAGHPGLAIGELASRGGIPSVLASDWYQNRIRPTAQGATPEPSGLPPALLRQLMQGGQLQPPPQ